MMRLFSLVMCALMTLCASAMVIPKGTFYFDNSKTKYANVKFVYGSDNRKETYVVSMTHDTGDRWKITFDKEVPDMYRYTFAATSLQDGKIEDTFPNVKEAISKTYNELRTATTSATILVGGIFVPTSGDNWAQGEWQSLNGSASYSGSLPTLFINTENGASIVSKETYVNATYYLDNMGDESVASVGSETEQLPMEIRGRGNYTWTGFDKKPYRIKLGSKTPLLGMKKSKLFALLAHADDQLGFLRNEVGFELSRRMGLDWTPSTHPVEVVLNGSYIGLYFLTETVRVDSDRVNIVEQEDQETDAEAITGGWLVEIDNYDEDLQVRITEGNGERIRFTYKTPELLSSAQENYLRNQMNALDDAIYVTNKNSTEWEDYVDLETLARFYVVQEIMDNTESFHGSCYMHKDKGADTKWKFGPVWDFGCTYYTSSQNFIYVNPPYGQTWIGEIAKFPRFQAKVKDIWKWFKGNKYEGVEEYIDDFIDKIGVASQYNYRKWSKYGNGNISDAKKNFKNKLTSRISWLVKQWGEGVVGLEDAIANNVAVSVTACHGGVRVMGTEALKVVNIYDMSGRVVATANPNSEDVTVICNNGLYVVEVITDSDIYRHKVVVR